MNTEMIRIGILGAGFIGKVHIQTFCLLEGVEITAVFDVNRQLVEQVADEYHIPNVYTSSDALFRADKVDAVIIGAPNKFHKPLAIQALQAGKHVLLEKPMALNGAEAVEIYRAQQQSGKIVMLAHQMRWEWVNQEIKKQAAQGAFGRIYHAKIGWLRRKGIPGWGSWFTRMDESGGGPLIDIGVHLLDLGRYLMGAPKPVTVFGAVYAEFGPRKKGLGAWGTPNWEGCFDVEDLASALIRMEDGSSVTLDVSWAAHIEKDNEVFIRLMGTEGGVSISNAHAVLCGEKFDHSVNIDLHPPEQLPDARIAFSQHFIRCIRTNTPPMTDALSGLTNNIIIDAIYQSAKSGKSIDLDWSVIEET